MGKNFPFARHKSAAARADKSAQRIAVAPAASRGPRFEDTILLEKRFEELKLTGNLPSPTGVGLAILKLTQREDASLDDLVAVIQGDPTLTGRIIKLANSAQVGGTVPVTTPHAAVMRLGFKTVRSVSLGFSLLSGNRVGRCPGFDYDDFWSHSLAAAAASQALSVSRTGIAPSDAFTCALLSGMGRLALASIHPQEYEGVLERARGLSSQELANIEQECFGTHHRELAAAMLRDWKLPTHYSEAVLVVGGGSVPEDVLEGSACTLGCILRDARDLARALTLKVDAPSASIRRVHADLEALRARLGLDPAQMARLWSEVSASWSAWGEMIQVRARPSLVIGEIQRRAQTPDTDEAGAGAVPGQAPVESAVAEPSTLRVLLVGHEARALQAICPRIDSEGYALAIAQSAREGLELALAQGSHVVVVDLDRCAADGLELVQTLRQSRLGGRMHFLALTEREDAPVLLQALENGVDEHVLKRADPAFLVARLRAAYRALQLSDRVEALLREREDQLSQLAILTRKLQVTAVTDPLTGVFNRRYALERLDREIKAARAASRPLSVIMLDLDRFKSVNDGYGHDVGDQVLRETARLLKATLRKGDTPCRMGGEEFLVICPHAGLTDALGIAERLRAATRQNVIEVGEFRRAVTISQGVAELDAVHSSVEALIKRADECVYLAKERGRDRVVGAREPAPLRDAV